MDSRDLLPGLEPGNRGCCRRMPLVVFSGAVCIVQNKLHHGLRRDTWINGGSKHRRRCARMEPPEGCGPA